MPANKSDATPEGDPTQWDRDHSWHPFSQMQEYLQFPPVHIASGRGCWLTDTQGKRYLDATASIWTNVHGHNDPDLNAAITDQLGKVAHTTMLGISHPAGAELARKLASIAPGDLTRSFFSDTGANAVEIALKMSLQYWQLRGHKSKDRVIGLRDAYHGDTMAAMAVGDSKTFHHRFRSWFFNTIKLPRPECEERGGRIIHADDRWSIKILRKLLERQAEKVTAVIMEPSVMGAAGMRLHPPGFLKKVADLCREFSVHLILDEIFVGFGRTGPMLVCAEDGVTPDFLCLAKGLSGGYLPLAATVVREPIYEAFLGPFEDFRAFFHGHTFTGNPLAAAVSLTSIRKLEPMIASGEIRRKVEVFGRMVTEHFENHPHVAAIRQRGLCAAIDLVADRESGASFPVPERFGIQVALRARDLGLLLRPIHDTLLLVPPLSVTGEEIRFLVEKTLSALDASLAVRHVAAPAH